MDDRYDNQMAMPLYSAVHHHFGTMAAGRAKLQPVPRLFQAAKASCLVAVHNLLIRLWNSKFNALFFDVLCKQFGNIRGEESSVGQIESPGKWCGMTFRMTILQRSFRSFPLSHTLASSSLIAKWRYCFHDACTAGEKGQRCRTDSTDQKRHWDGSQS